ncbi:uncharacterized protein IL334_006946 [Kwoniella shivajii]|uniref:DUF7137 domain-containing protein n=1 Tax=Kwoniella shivajii TaxID=564305 RepID=A0ABZ1D7C5_9TREE|nr:hypothetical protein IL334_006946 [Kwoniella shivajii]
MSASGSVTARPSVSASGSASAPGSSGNRNSSSTASISIPATAAAGGITVTQPPSTASASYYKIAQDNWITFGWNATSLYVQPSSLTIVASCSANGNIYPVGPNPTPSGNVSANVFPGNTTKVVWNPYEWEQIPGQVPFAEATYVLKIYDERGDGAAVKGGYLSPYAGKNFMMYRPGGYTSLSDGWTCSTCSDAFTTFAQPAHLAIFTSLLITILSAWGILRR